MPVRAGELVELSIEKPASGGRMIARHQGQVILVSGAIPGEQVTARVTHAGKRMAFAEVAGVQSPSSDRRAAAGDPACGGSVYSHIAYPRQVRLKAEIVQDAFVRIGRIPLPQQVAVASGAEHDYRMKARFHVRNGRAGFYREGTHELCDPRQVRQMSASAIDAVDSALDSLAGSGVTALSAEVAENIRGDQRAVHFEVIPSPSLRSALAQAVREANLDGVTARSSDGAAAAAGDPIVSDTLADLTNGRAAAGVLQRHPESFFQANRFLVSSLVATVLDTLPAGPVLDLYAGVGLFSVALAACGRREVIAVEGDPVSGGDLERNASACSDRLQVVPESVEGFLERRGSPPGHSIVVDPPRTGMSKQAAESLVRTGAPRIVYVSCDPPTLARDARRLLDAGYRLDRLEAFDLFPNTPHVEAIATFLGP